MHRLGTSCHEEELALIWSITVVYIPVNSQCGTLELGIFPAIYTAGIWSFALLGRNLLMLRIRWHILGLMTDTQMTAPKSLGAWAPIQQPLRGLIH